MQVNQKPWDNSFDSYVPANMCTLLRAQFIYVYIDQNVL